MSKIDDSAIDGLKAAIRGEIVLRPTPATTEHVRFGTR